MKGYRFYIDFGSNQDTKTNPLKKMYSIRDGRVPSFPQNCLAIFLDSSQESLRHNNTYEGFGAVYFTQNSPVNVTGISPDYLRYNCTRCSEELARKLHPELFLRLDN